MIAGDPGIEDIYKWTPEGQNTAMRGKSGTGDGVHILTGPIYVCGAEPGDVLQVGWGGVGWGGVGWGGVGWGCCAAPACPVLPGSLKACHLMHAA